MILLDQVAPLVKRHLKNRHSPPFLGNLFQYLPTFMASMHRLKTQYLLIYQTLKYASSTTRLKPKIHICIPKTPPKPPEFTHTTTPPYNKDLNITFATCKIIPAFLPFTLQIYFSWKHFGVRKNDNKKTILKKSNITSKYFPSTSMKMDKKIQTFH